MYPKLNDTIAQTLAGMSGLLFTVAPEDRKANGPIMTGFLEKRVKGDGDEYKTVTRLEVAGFNAEGNGKKYVRLQIAGGLTTATLFKNETPKGDNPPASSGGVGSKDESELKIAAYNQDVNGKKAFRLSVYTATANGQGGKASGPSKSAPPVPDDDIPFAAIRNTTLHMI